MLPKVNHNSFHIHVAIKNISDIPGDKKKQEQLDNNMDADPIFAIVTMILSASYFLDIYFF